MIQRIQSVYLFLAIALTASLFFVPYAELTNKAGDLFLLDSKGLYPATPSNAVPIFANSVIIFLCAASIAILITTVFRYKSLGRQISLSKIGLLILLILAGTVFYEIYKANNLLGGTYSIKIFSAFPVISIILVWLAMRGMHKDDQLLKSIDRIR
jgi:drug/metabolite transporter (DMT)-like permease